jgi:hypothetical protein
MAHHAQSVETLPSPPGLRPTLLMQFDSGHWCAWISPRLYATGLDREDVLGRLTAALERRSHPISIATAPTGTAAVGSLWTGPAPR